MESRTGLGVVDSICRLAGSRTFKKITPLAWFVCRRFYHSVSLDWQTVFFDTPAGGFTAFLFREPALTGGKTGSRSFYKQLTIK